jgi:hypothetical protein
MLGNYINKFLLALLFASRSADDASRFACTNFKPGCPPRTQKFSETVVKIYEACIPL